MEDPTRWGFECYGCSGRSIDSTIIEFMPFHMHGMSMTVALKCSTEKDPDGVLRIVFPDVPDDPVRWISGGEGQTTERPLDTWIRAWPLDDDEIRSSEDLRSGRLFTNTVRSSDEFPSKKS